MIAEPSHKQNSSCIVQGRVEFLWVSEQLRVTEKARPRAPDWEGAWGRAIIWEAGACGTRL